MKQNYVIAINPGSTSTKVAVYKNRDVIHNKNIIHSTKELSNFKSITEQYDFRKDRIYSELRLINFNKKLIGAVVGRGGLLRPVTSGVYKVNEKMINELKKKPKEIFIIMHMLLNF